MPKLTSPSSVELKNKLNRRTARRRTALGAAAALEKAAASPGSRNDLSPTLKFLRLPIEELMPAKRRVRNSNPGQVERLVRIIKVTGICAPILIDQENHIIDGHSVVAAAKSLGLTTIPCAVINHLTQTEIEFLKVAINRVSECGEWDLDQLRPLLIELGDEEFTLTDTGFSIPEIDVIILPEVAGEVCCDEVHQPPTEPVSKPGDLWLLGKHRLYCGDSTLKPSYDTALAGACAHAIFTDPPWNIPIKGFVSSSHQDFKMGAGEMSPTEFKEFLTSFCRLSLDALEDGGVMFSCIDWRSIELMIGCAREVGLLLINTAVWNKGSGGMGGLYRSAHELIPILCKGATPKTNNVRLGKHGRDRTNVWTYPGANRQGSSASDALKHHPTPKPIEMVQDAIIDVTNPGEVVLDSFMGSGTTLLAAERTDRIACGIELDPRYVDVAVMRWEKTTGRDAVHEDSGQTFAEITRRRSEGVPSLERNRPQS